MVENKITVIIDPRIEIMNMIQYVCDEDKRLEDILIGDNSKYKNSLIGHFNDFHSHPVFKSYREMISHGFSYDAPHVVILSSSWPEFDIIHTIPGDVVSRAGGNNKIEELTSNLQDLVLTSGFEEFIKSWQNWFDSLINSVKSHLSKSKIEDHLNYYFKDKSKRYSVVLSPLMRGGYGISLPNDEVISLLGLNWLKGSTDDYLRLDEYLLHEWSHSFINPIIYANKDLILKTSFLFEPISKVMKSYAYVDWVISLSEHLVRAVTVRLHDILGNKAFSKQMKNEHIDLGFIYIEQIIDLLEIYENEQDEYSDFASFYPVIMDVLAN